jgi:N-acetylneuraminic acid mutarotase
VLTVFRPAAAFLTAAVLLAGCGGGGGSTRVAPPSTPAETSPSGTAKVTLTFIVPKGASAKQRAAQAGARQPKYITASTAAIKVTLTAVNHPTTHVAVTPPGGLPQTTTLQVTTTSQNPNAPGQCGADPANAGNIKCTMTIDLPLGDDALTIATYDGFSAGAAAGNIISQQRAVVSVQQGVVNTFTFTLDANSGAFTITVPQPVTLASGTNCAGSSINGASDISATCTATLTGTSPVNFTVNVADAHGSTIPLGAPGAPVLSVSSSNNANYTVALSGNTLTITPHANSVSAKITVTATPPNTSGASPGDGLSTILIAFNVNNVPSVSWKTRTSTGLPRQNGAAGVLGGLLYLAGGTTKPAATFVNTGSTQVDDPSAGGGNGAWTTLGNMNIPRTFVAGDAAGGKFFVVGGNDTGGNPTGAAEGYDTSPSCVPDPGPPPVTCPNPIPPIGWTTFTSMHHPRNHHRAVAIGARLFVFGGDSDNSGTLVALPEAYTTDTDSWADLAPMPTPRDDVAVAVLNGFIYVIGGRSALSPAVTVVERYDPLNNVWSTTAPLPAPLRHQNAATINGRIYVAGGYPGSGSPSAASVYFYDPASNTWTPGPAMPFASTLTETSAQGNNLLYILNVGPNSDQVIELSSP